MLHKRLKKNTASQSGFTLIEIVIALGIVSIAVLALVKAITSSAHIASELESRVLASWIASNQMTQLQYDNKLQNSSVKSSNKNIKLAGQNWRCQTTVTPLENNKVRLVTVNVFNGDNDKLIFTLNSAVTKITSSLN